MTDMYHRFSVQAGNNSTTTSERRMIAQKIVTQLQNKGFTAAFVGGCVRDGLLGLVPKDYDVVTSARPPDVETVFDRTLPIGKKFGIVTVLWQGQEIEVATLRSERHYEDGRRPGQVEFVSSLQEDAQRRDFTVNAMYLDPITGKLYDFFGGRADLDARLIRCVGDAYQRIREDKLRMLRAVRFAAHGFQLDPYLHQAIKECAHQVTACSQQRIRDELKGILTSPDPVRGLELLMELGLMQYILPEVVRLNGPEGDQDPIWHPEGNVWAHTRLVVSHLAGSSFELVLAGLLHDIGKPDTQVRHENGRISNHNHEFVGADIARNICRRLRMTNKQVEAVAELVANHMRMHVADRMRKGTLGVLMLRPDFDELVALQNADAMGCTSAESKSLREFFRNKRLELEQSQAACNGDDNGQSAKFVPLLNGHVLKNLGLKPGPIFAEILSAGLEAQLEGQFQDLSGAEAWVRQHHLPVAAGRDSEIRGGSP